MLPLRFISQFDPFNEMLPLRQKPTTQIHTLGRRANVSIVQRKKYQETEKHQKKHFTKNLKLYI